MALKDISIGSYMPGDSPLHRLDPRAKLMMLILYIVMLFLVSNPLGYLLVAGFLVLAYALARIPVRLILKSLKPLIPIILITAILNVFLSTGRGDPLVKWWIITIYPEGVQIAVSMAVRIVCLIAGTSLLTFTTTPISLTDGLEQLMSPLKKIKFPAHELAMMMTIALRFIPTLVEETDKIMNAQKARGADLESGGLFQRIRALIPILVPLFVSAFRRADELALAMECRCYRGGEGRTRLKVLRFHRGDLWAALLLCGVTAAIILVNIFVPSIF